MCELLSCDSLKVARQLLHVPGWRSLRRFRVTRGVDGELYDTAHRVFDVPYAALFTLRVEEEGKTLWSGVFAFDLLQPKPQRWSLAQAASRGAMDYLRPHHSDYNTGCDITVELADAYAAPGSPSLRQLFKETERAANLEAAAANIQAAENPAALQSRLHEFTACDLETILAMDPAEFRIYKMTSTAHEHYDYVGCANRERIRIVSRPGCAHQLLYQFRPYRVGFKPDDPLLFARGIQSHLRSRLRKEGVKPGTCKQALARWDARIELELLGPKEPVPTGIGVWTAAKPEKRLVFILGKGRVSGLTLPSIDTTYGQTSEVRALNELVSLTCDYVWRNKPEVAAVVLTCKNANGARHLVEQLAEGRLDVVTIAGTIKSMSFYYDNPPTYASHAGYGPEDIGRLKTEFERRSGRKRYTVEKDRSLIRISARK